MTVRNPEPLRKTARGSALECAAVLDALEAIHLASELELREPAGDALPDRLMLTKMIEV
jgi:hypothetical protein